MSCEPRGGLIVCRGRRVCGFASGGEVRELGFGAVNFQDLADISNEPLTNERSGVRTSSDTSRTMSEER